MIITYPKITPFGPKITNEILDNKVLFYCVIVRDEHITAEGRLASIRQMLDAFKEHPPENLEELVTHYGYMLFKEKANQKGRLFVEAFFDQHSASAQGGQLMALLNKCEGKARNYVSFGLAMISALIKPLPKKVPYAEEHAFVEGV